MILFGEKHVRHVVDEFIDHYNKERPHQGIGNRLITEPEEPVPRDGTVLCRKRLHIALM